MKKLKLNEQESIVKSSYRTLALFEFFAEIQRPATVAEISLSLQIPQSSTSVILKSLLETSFLSFNQENRTFEPTMRMAFLSDWMTPNRTHAAQFPSILEQLRDQLQETTVLAMRNGIYSQYILVKHYDEILGRHVETGSVRPMVLSATGWSLLKEESDLEIGKLIRRTVHEIKDQNWRALSEKALQNIQHARDKGYAVSKGESADGAAGIAVNLPTSHGFAQLAIAVAGPKDRVLLQEQTIADALQAVAAAQPTTLTREILN